MKQKGIAIVILMQPVCLSLYAQDKRPNGSAAKLKESMKSDESSKIENNQKIN